MCSTGCAAARTPSRSLDLVGGEFLEEGGLPVDEAVVVLHAEVVEGGLEEGALGEEPLRMSSSQSLFSRSDWAPFEPPAELLVRSSSLPWTFSPICFFALMFKRANSGVFADFSRRAEMTSAKVSVFRHPCNHRDKLYVSILPTRFLE